LARLLGIDVTSSAVRIALLRSGVRKPRLVALREELRSDHESSGAALRAAMTGLRADSCATAIPGDRAFVRRIALPSAAQRELANVLSFEVESTLPLELDDAVMDHRVLKRQRGVDDKDTIPILAGVAYTDEVRDVINLVRRGTGQEPVRVGLGPLPLANLIANTDTPPSHDVAVLDLGDEHADFLVMVNGEPRFSRCLSRGVSGLPDGAPALARELKHTLNAWRALGGATPTGICLTGSGHAIHGIDGFIENELECPLLPVPDLAVEGIGSEDRAKLPRFAKALGLALSLARRPVDLNLRQGPLATQQSFQFLREKVPLLAGLAAAIMVSFGFSVFAELRALGTERTMLEQQLADTTRSELGKETRKPEDAAKLLQDTIAGVKDDPLPEIDAFKTLVEFAKRVPSEITHDIAKFDYKPGALKINGVVPKIEDRDAIMAKLEEYECFREVTPGRTSQLKDGKQKYLLNLVPRCSDAKPKKKKPAKPGGAKR